MTEPGSDLEAPMITLNETTLHTLRPRERKLATVTVWCISVPNTSDANLQSSLDWVCGPLANQGQVNCGPINSGGACFDPDTVAHHCDWAFNAYFLRMNATAEACDFGGTAQQTTTDPSTFLDSTPHYFGTALIALVSRTGSGRVLSYPKVVTVAG